MSSKLLLVDLLLEQNGAETSVEGTNTLALQHLAETADQTTSVGRLGDETDTGGLKRTEGNVGEELGAGGGGQVDTSAVVGGVLVADQVDGLLLEELVTTELEGTLEEVASGGRAETGQKGTSALILDDLLEATDQTAVVGDGVELDTGLDAVHWILLAASMCGIEGSLALILIQLRCHRLGLVAEGRMDVGDKRTGAIGSGLAS